MTQPMRLGSERLKNFGPADSRSYKAGWWLRLGVVVATLLVAVVIGLRPTTRLALLPALLVLGLLGLVVLLRYLPWGVIALVPLSFLVDIPIKTGTNVQLNATFLLIILLLGAWALRMLVIDRRLRLVASPANLPALLFVAACTLAWLASFLPWLPLASGRPSLPAQAGAYLLYVLSIGALLLALNHLNTLRLVKIFTWTYLGFGVLYLFVSFGGSSVVYRWLVNAQYGQSVFWTLLTALSAGQGLFNRDLKWPARVGLLAVAALTVGYAMFIRSTWISGWLPPLIVIFVLVWLRNWRLGLVVTVFSGLVLLIPFSDFWANQVNDPTQQWSTFTRFATWPIVINLLKANPLTGLGPAVYPYFTSLFFYLGYFVQFNSHNNYFDIALQTGLLGLGIFIWLVVAIFRAGWKVRRLATDGFSVGYANAILAALAAVLVAGTFADWFLPFVYNIGIPGFQGSVYTWLFAGGLLSLYNLQIAQAKTD
jgi:O-antigen ligase